MKKLFSFPQEHSYRVNISRVSTPRNEDARGQDVFLSLVYHITISYATTPSQMTCGASLHREDEFNKHGAMPSRNV